MNGIKMSDCKFYVNEVARTVICVIPNTKSMLRDYISEHFDYPDVSIWEALYWKEIYMPKSFIGKAVCSTDDEWNEELGRMIAFSRAKDKCYKSFFKRANALVQLIDRRLGDMIETFNDLGMKLEGKREALEHMIEEGLNKKEGDA